MNRRSSNDRSNYDRDYSGGGQQSGYARSGEQQGGYRGEYGAQQRGWEQNQGGYGGEQSGSGYRGASGE